MTHLPPNFAQRILDAARIAAAIHVEQSRDADRAGSTAGVTFVVDRDDLAPADTTTPTPFSRPARGPCLRF